MSRTRRTRAAATGLALATVPLVLAACGSAASPPASAAQTSLSPTPAPLTSVPLTSGAMATPSGLPGLATAPTVVLTRFAKYGPDAQAVTYDPARVPVDADVAAVLVQTTGQTMTLLAVRGLAPNQHFGAHVHTGACGAKPADAGSHFQHQPDPKQPSVDPAYANPRNEIWLDFSTDKSGSAHVESAVAWTFGDRPHGSIVIHAEPTSSEPGHAGTAGGRLACVDI
jgi:Cu-Zn family superoxide dismutase